MQYHIRTGDLNRRVTIQQRRASVDAFGQQVQTWTDLLTCWAHIEPLTGRELLSAQALVSEVSYQVTILYRPEITAAMRVLYRDKVFSVGAVIDPDAEHIGLQLLCSEGANRSEEHTSELQSPKD